MEPTTIWNPTSGEGEYTATGNPNLDSEAGLDLITEASLNLVEEDASFSGVPVTVWTTADGS